MAPEKTSYLAQGIIIVADENEGPCILIPFFVPSEKKDFDAQVAAGKVEDGRKIYSYLWLDAPVQSDEADVIAGKMRPFGELGNVKQ